MFSKKVKAYPLCAWLLCAVFALIAQYAAGRNWLTVLAAGIGSTLLCWCDLVLLEGQTCERKWYCVIQIPFLILAASVTAGWSAEAWQTGQTYPAVPLALLVLATFSAWNGAEQASRAGSIAFWFVALLFAVILAAGVRDVKPAYLLPKWQGTDCVLIYVFLLPMVTSFLPREGAPCYTKTLMAVVVMAVVIAVLTVGTLSQQVAAEESFPFYTFSKSLSLFGVAERFESLVSVALTMGQYSLLSLLLSGVGHMADRIRPGRGRTGVVFGAVSAAALMTFAVKLPGSWLGALALLFWGILPLLLRNTKDRKKCKKIEKTA